MTETEGAGPFRHLHLTRSALLVAGAVALVVVALVSWRVAGPPEIHPPGDGLRFDDFEFTALGAEARAAIGPARPSAPGRAFYVVDVRITNRARRVSYAFRGDVVGAIDAAGVALERSEAGQRAEDDEMGEPQMAAHLEVGDVVTRRIVLEGPAGLDELRVGFLFGGRVGATLDALFIGRRLVAVPVRRAG